jgi:hypothetical protein
MASEKSPWVEALLDNGFVVAPGPIPAARWDRFCGAYDAAMAAGRPPELAIGSTSTRLHGLVDWGAEFDDLYLDPRLLEVCHRVIGRPFKLSSLIARTVSPRARAQDLHVDFEADASGFPMLGFIVMVDGFCPDNGATRFACGPHVRVERAGERLACGPPGSLIVYNGSVRHAHGANRTSSHRRSVQGAFIRRDATGWIDRARISRNTRERLGPLARYLLMIDA